MNTKEALDWRGVWKCLGCNCQWERKTASGRCGHCQGELVPYERRAPAPTHDAAFEALAREYKSDANAERHDRDSYAEERVAARDDFAERIFAILAQKGT